MEDLNKKTQAHINAHNNLTPTTKEGYLYRGITLRTKENASFNELDFTNMLNGLTPGESCILDYAPMCTGSFDTAASYASNAILKLKIPAGAKFSKGGEETRIPAMAKFVFNGVKELKNGFKVFDFEYVLPE